MGQRIRKWMEETQKEENKCRHEKFTCPIDFSTHSISEEFLINDNIDSVFSISASLFFPLVKEE